MAQGWIALETDARTGSRSSSSATAWRRGPDPDRRPGKRAWRRSVPRWAVRSLAAAGRDRQRQDRGLSAVDRSACCSAGGQALVLVPEINLTPQLEARLSRSAFPDAALASLHSNVPEAERLRRWRAAESGQARIVIGTRLAVFTPMPQLGLIVVDEEHDASLKQQDGLRYSARDLAVLRAKQREVPVVLGSATPSLESYANALRGPLSSWRSCRCAPARSCRRSAAWTRAGSACATGLSQPLIEALGARLDGAASKAWCSSTAAATRRR